VFTANTVGTAVISASYSGKTASNKLNVTVIDSVVRVEWSGASVSPDTVSVGGQATISRGTIKAVYSSGREVDVTSSATLTATNGTISGNVFTANAVGIAVISASYSGKTASSKLNVIVEVVPAYVGGGTTAEDACVPANVVSEYGGSKPVEYTAHADAGDYYYFIFPEGTTISGITAGPFGVPYENLGIQTINGYRYQVYRNYDMQATSVDDTFIVTFNY
jgi:hypothetical protein